MSSKEAAEWRVKNSGLADSRLRAPNPVGEDGARLDAVAGVESRANPLPARGSASESDVVA
jgi:hypothetical protein